MRLILSHIFILFALIAQAQINIWDGTSCHKKVTLTPFIANGNDSIAVIVCPGGSYFWHDTETEGIGVAMWLQKNGISAFVLDYRTANVPAFIFHHRLIFRGNRYPDPQDDLKQALRIVRMQSKEFGIRTDRIGAMGFSAGGHLVMSSGELFEPEDRPNFIVPIYPVVTMIEPCVHKRSQRGLLGDNKQNNKTLRELLSLERHVPNDCPPVFLVNCKDDPIVHYHNSELLDSALTSNNVKHIYIQYKTGGHGFGASGVKGSAECRQWRDICIKWIKDLFK